MFMSLLEFMWLGC